MRADETIDFQIRLAWHKISRLYNSAAAQHGGSMSLGYILLNIDSKEGSPSTSLGPKMGMEATSLARTLKTMEEKKLIFRKSDKTDKRKVRIFLTDLGMEMRELSKNTVIQFNEKVQAMIASHELSTFFKVINQLNNILETEDIFNHNGK